MNRLTLMLLIVAALVSGLVAGAWFFDGIDPKVVSQLERRLAVTNDELLATQNQHDQALIELDRRPTFDAVVKAEAAVTQAEQALARAQAQLLSQRDMSEDRVRQLTEQLETLQAIDVDALLSAAQAKADAEILALQAAAADQVAQVRAETSQRIAQANEQAADRVAALNREAREALARMASDKDNVIGQLLERMMTNEAEATDRWSSAIDEKDRLIAQLTEQLSVVQANAKQLQRQLNETTIEADALSRRLRAAENVIEQLRATPPIQILIDGDSPLNDELSAQN